MDSEKLHNVIINGKEYLNNLNGFQKDFYMILKHPQESKIEEIGNYLRKRFAVIKVYKNSFSALKLLEEDLVKFEKKMKNKFPQLVLIKPNTAIEVRFLEMAQVDAF